MNLSNFQSFSQNVFDTTYFIYKTQNDNFSKALSRFDKIQSDIVIKHQLFRKSKCLGYQIIILIIFLKKMLSFLAKLPKYSKNRYAHN